MFFVTKKAQLVCFLSAAISVVATVIISSPDEENNYNNYNNSPDPS